MTAPRIVSDGCYHPASEDEVAALARDAAVAGRIVRVRGAAHSVDAAIFAYAHCKRRPDPDGVDILLDRMRRIEADDATMRITVEARCNLGRDPVDPSGTSTGRTASSVQVVSKTSLVELHSITLESVRRTI